MMKKRILLGTVGLFVLSLAAPASAADIAARPYTKAPPAPVPPPPYDWSGFYIGGNGGWGTSRNCWDLSSFFDTTFTPGRITTFSPLTPEGCHDANGGTAGGQIGYRWQASNWVFGLEGQGNWANFRGNNVSLFFAPDFNRTRIESFGLLTGQFGYAWNNVLFYWKGGGAVTGNRFDAFSSNGVILGTSRPTRWGGTAGAGIEWGFAPNWSLGFEYDHLFMGNQNVTFTDVTGAFLQTDRIRQDVDIVTARINWHFGWGGLGTTRY